MPGQPSLLHDNVSLTSSGNILEFNVLADTNRLTTDTGAIEMLGGGSPAAVAWFNNNTIRYNNISHTVGSSSSDGAHVCVHGEPDLGCRRLVWGIYLDGGETGIIIHGNVIGASLHGAVFDNAGGNNTQYNNIFLGGDDSPILMDFGNPPPTAPRSVGGNVMRRNLFVWRGGRRPSAHSIYASQEAWTPAFLKPNGSDYNLFWMPDANASASARFPGGQTLQQWRGIAPQAIGPVLCGSLPGSESLLVVSMNCSYGWVYNGTDHTFRAAGNASFAMAIHCTGGKQKCTQRPPDRTQICLDTVRPRPPPRAPAAPPLDSMAWTLHPQTGEITADGSGLCLEVCTRGGAVGGCDGTRGSIAQLARCSGAPKQRWAHDATTGALRSLSTGGSASPDLCLTPPKRPRADAFDEHSIVADPMFVDASRGDFRLHPSSPAITELGFEPIPPIDAPLARCTDAPSPTAATSISCLSLALAASGSS